MKVALTRESEAKDYNGVWESLPAPAESPLKEPAFLLPLSSSKITTQQESIWTLEFGGIRKTADLVNLCPHSLWGDTLKLRDSNAPTSDALTQALDLNVSSP